MIGLRARRSPAGNTHVTNRAVVQAAETNRAGWSHQQRPSGSVGTFGAMRWPAFDAVAFDCDSTLTTIEGIDELAIALGKSEEVADLTNAAMNGQMDLADVYGARLALLEPSLNDVRGVRSAYKKNVIPDAKATIAALQDHGTQTVVVSGGLYEPVLDFSTWLGIDPSNVRAVNSEYDPLVGDWWHEASDSRYLDFHQGPLTQTRGKGELIEEMIGHSRRSIMIGDGMSDLAAAESVNLFVAYTGVIDRPAVAQVAPVVIRSRELAPLLALTLGPSLVAEIAKEDSHAAVASSCMELVSTGAVTFNDAQLGRAFQAAIDHNWEL